MGLSTLWSAVAIPRIKENNAPKISTTESQTRIMFSGERPITELRRAAPNASLKTPSHDSEDKKARRRSRGFSWSKKKPNEAKKRRSGFGGKPTQEQNVPAVPTLPQAIKQAHGRAQESVPSDPIAKVPLTVTVNDHSSWRRADDGATDECRVEDKTTRRMSISLALMKKRSTSSIRAHDRVHMRTRSKSVMTGTNSGNQSSKRASWFYSNKIKLESDAPPLPEIPSQSHIGKKPASARLSELDKRKSRKTSLDSIGRIDSNISSASVKSSRRQRRSSSWWQSSNPDHDSFETTALPPLPVSHHPRPKTAHDAKETTTTVKGLGQEPVAPFSKSSEKPRALSTSSANRKSYVPRYAASGFAKSTSGVPEDVRKSYRRSLKMQGLFDDEEGIAVLSEEQQAEWEQLKHLMLMMDQRNSNAGKDTATHALNARPLEGDSQQEAKYSNADALAALEFGMAT